MVSVMVAEGRVVGGTEAGTGVCLLVQPARKNAMAVANLAILEYSFFIFPCTFALIPISR